MNRIITLLIIVFGAVCSVKAQCTVVNDNGSVTITSSLYTDAIIERYDDGEWVEIGSLSSGEYTDNDADANLKVYKYRFPIDTELGEFSTLRCTVTEGQDDVKLEWNTDDKDISYNIYRKLFAENEFKLIMHTADNTVNEYVDLRISSCLVQYKIEAVREDCNSMGNTVEIAKSDNEQPQIPFFKGIDVDLQTQIPVIKWQPSLSNDTWGYVICQVVQDGTKQPLDTVYGGNAQSYTCTSCSAKDYNYITLCAFDSCLQTSPLTDTYRNVVLKAQRNGCSDPVLLEWNDFTENGDIHPYDIYMSIDDNDFNQIQIGYTSLSYQYDIPVTGDRVRFYVATSQNDESGIHFTSNVIEFAISGQDTLDYIYLENASVSEDNTTVTLEVDLDGEKQVKEYELWRSIDGSGFEKIRTWGYTGASYFVLEDKAELPVSEHLYTYYVSAPDVCSSGLYSKSNTVSPMRLKIDATDNSKIKIVWNMFTPASWRVQQYELYRFSEGDIDDAELVAYTSSTSYTDNSENFVSNTDRVFYYVKASNDNQAGNQQRNYTALSSTSSAKFETLLYIPTAFAPKETSNIRNTLFKPECHFIKNGTYSMKIYNRKGQLLFETNNPDEGWDGTYKDEFCPVGNYVYKIKFVDSDGMEQNKGGVFLLYD